MDGWHWWDWCLMSDNLMIEWLSEVHKDDDVTNRITILMHVVFVHFPQSAFFFKHWAHMTRSCLWKYLVPLWVYKKFQPVSGQWLTSQRLFVPLMVGEKRFAQWMHYLFGLCLVHPIFKRDVFLYVFVLFLFFFQKPKGSSFILISDKEKLQPAHALHFYWK